ncbi:MAG: DUF6526 family protein [Flavisolibacter sp.]
MNEQNFQNHRQYVFGYHILTSILIFAFLGGAITNLVLSSQADKYDAWLLVLAAVIFILLGWYARAFALRAQDRAIRAEEHLRYFILTGKKMDQRISMRQIIALRFAGDEEYPSLVQKAADENLGSDSIKKEIRKCRADRHRA